MAKSCAVQVVMQDIKDSPEELSLPPGFKSISEVDGLTPKELLQKPLVNVIGIVQDYQPPIKTRGTDWKCSIGITDMSKKFEKQGMKVTIFYPEDKMPQISGLGDILVIKKVKAQWYGSCVSLLVNFATQLNVFYARDIPVWSPDASKTVLQTSSGKDAKISTTEADYVVWLHNHMDDIEMPSVEDFKEKQNQAMSRRDKFSLFKDLKDESFNDLIGEVIQIIDTEAERITVYLSDYTAHTLFYNHQWPGSTNSLSESREGDEYGYTKRDCKASKDWPGPFGKMSLQITVYDYHAGMIREQVKPGNWLMLKNVQVKMGRVGGRLEGMLRYDRGSGGDKVQVALMEVPHDVDLIDPRLKEAIRRKRDYKQRHEKHMRRIADGTAQADGKKRKNDGELKLNSKQRRRLGRAAAAVEKNVGVIEVPDSVDLQLNTSITCNHPSKPYVSIRDFLDQSRYLVNLGNGISQPAPFSNIQCRATVRVVDYWPHRMEDFSVGRQVSEFDVLSDHSDDESSDSEAKMEQFRQGKGWGGPKQWEWRFALRLEDMDQPGPAQVRAWLVVDNPSAQMLLDMDAVDLRTDTEALVMLREKLFTLWGDLGEKKCAFLEQPLGEALRSAVSTVTLELESSSDSEDEPQTNLTRPKDYNIDEPTDSDEEDLSMVKKSGKNRALPAVAEQEQSKPHPETTTRVAKTPSQVRKLTTDQARIQLESAVLALEVKNRAFACCIRQYGIKVVEHDEMKANAGNGERWQRVLAMFDTKIN